MLPSSKTSHSLYNCIDDFDMFANSSGPFTYSLVPCFLITLQVPDTWNRLLLVKELYYSTRGQEGKRETTTL